MRTSELLFAVSMLGLGVGCNADLISATLVAELANTCVSTHAVPDDGLDDRATMQSELDVFGCVLLEPGQYDLSNDPLPGTSHMHSLMVHAGGMIEGTGMSGESMTTLNFYGDGQMGDWNGIGFNGNGATVRSLHIKFSGFNTEEQTHAIEVRNVSNTALSYLSFDWQRPSPTNRMGDCVRVRGEPDTQATNTTIENMEFAVCSRTAVGIQRQTYGLSIEDSHFGSCGTDIDAELTGDWAAVGGSWWIRRNVFDTGPDNQGGSSVTLEAQTQIDNVLLEDNTWNGRGLWAHNANNVEFRRNTVEQTTPSAVAVLHFQKSSTGIVVEDNTRIARWPSAGPGAVIQTSHHNSGFPGSLYVRRNGIEQWTNGNVLYLQSYESVDVNHNLIERKATGSTQIAGVDLSGVGRRAGIASIADNAFVGQLAAATRGVGSYFGIGDVDYSGNTSTSAGFVQTPGTIGRVSGSGNSPVQNLN